MLGDNATIAAIATPLAPAGVGILRLSGTQSKAIAKKVFTPKSGADLESLPGYTLLYGKVHDKNGDIDEALALIFTAPRSYTGEDVVELSCHGGVYVLQKVLSAVIDAGATLAQPGEFTKRAFLNGKIDLPKAEAVMQLICAQGESAARAAMSALKGALSNKLQNIKEKLINLSSHLAAWADFPEEDIPEVSADELNESLKSILGELNALLEDYSKGKAVFDGISTVIVGRPNVGKSTLMNLLAQKEKSIVTPIAGTTRDIVEETVTVNGIMLRLADTAGIRDTKDQIESIGVSRSLEKIKSAQLILVLFDSSEEITEEDLKLIDLVKDIPSIAVINKSDLPQRLDTKIIEEYFSRAVFVSAAKNLGIDSLKQAIAEVTGTDNIDLAAPLLANERQRATAAKAREAVYEAVMAIEGGMTLDAVSVNIEEALDAILQLTGERASEAVVDEVFSRFCVGK